MDIAVKATRKPERLASAWLGTTGRYDPHYHGSAEHLDRMINAWIGRFTANISPASLWIAYFDWLVHLQLSPSKQQQLLTEAGRKWWQWHLYLLHHVTPDMGRDEEEVTPLPQDKRFSDPAWDRWPFNAISQGFLLTQQWWHRATTGVTGVSRHHEDVVTFVTRQLLDMMSPSNFASTNPVVQRETLRSGGMNLVRGTFNAIKAWERNLSGQPPSDPDFRVGETMAITPGQVVYRNRLIELIQYAPATPQVYSRPLLFVPAWIMKYYILDLSPDNSLVRYMVNKGYTVFMISWKNPTAEDRDLTMEDYRQLGIMHAIDAITRITGSPSLNAVGYCLGGTLLSIAAAAMARDMDDRLASMTLFASQVDFKEPGELSLFIDESEIALLESTMWDQGFLDTRQMAGAFQLLRSNDLIWSRRLHHYVLGLPEKSSDLMAWNADATRMPYRMHTQYLRDLFLRNDLAEGRYLVDDRPVALTDIRVPIFSVGTRTDHVAPWRSAFKVHLLTDTEVTFLLCSGGHNAGVVSPPTYPNSSYQMATRAHDDPYIDPDVWEATTTPRAGSWWPAWEYWLSQRSGEKVDAKPLGKGLCDAPGTYVLVP